MECSNGAVRTAFDIQIDGKCGPGRPKMTWKQLTERDCREWKLLDIDPQDRHTWRSGVRSAMMQQASYLERGPLMWMLPLYVDVNQKSNDDDDDYQTITNVRRFKVGPQKCCIQTKMFRLYRKMIIYGHFFLYNLHILV